MSEITGHPLFGLTLTALAYLTSLWIYRRTQLVLLHPLPVSAGLVCAFLLLTGTPYEEYNIGGSYLTFLLTPATVCLALPLYDKLPEFRQNAGGILISLSVGCVTALICVWGLCRLFRLPDILLYSLLPKSVTTAVAIEVSASLGGLRAITVLAVLMAGLTGGLYGPSICRLLGIHHPIAQGLAIGTASHALGTARAVEEADKLGAEVGAAGGLAIGVCGLITALLAPLLLKLLTLF